MDIELLLGNADGKIPQIAPAFHSVQSKSGVRQCLVIRETEFDKPIQIELHSKEE